MILPLHPMSFAFPKDERLKRKKLFEALFREGSSITVYPIKLIYLRTPLSTEKKNQAAMAVPKKNFRKAVQRNRVKRMLREAYRLNKSQVFNNSYGKFAFLFLYIGKEMVPYGDIERNMQAVLRKFLKKEVS
ncbi:MAG: ribonuclease P protein component [Bacteroidota bacterium]